MISLTGITNAKSFGDSYTFGNWATNYFGYIQRFCAERGINLTNYAVGGNTCYDQLAKIFSDNDQASLKTLLIGLNDLRALPAPPQTLTIERIKGTVRSLLASHFAAQSFPANAWDIIKSGFTNDIAGQQVRASQGLNGKGRSSNAIGNTLTWVFTGTNAVVGYMACSGTSYVLGRFTVSIDGAVVATIVPNGGSDVAVSVMPQIAYFPGLSSGSHILVITAIDSTNCMIDWVGTLKNPAYCSPILILKIPHLSTAGYAAFSTPPLSDALIDIANDGIAAAVNEYSAYPVALVETNSFYNPTSGASISPDTYHPNDLGHTQIKAALDAAINTSHVLTDVTLKSDGMHLWWQEGSQMRKII